jgi:hypothetical protein
MVSDSSPSYSMCATKNHLTWIILSEMARMIN